MNSLSELTPQILIDMLPLLREKCVMPRLVNSSFSTSASRKGKSVEINDIEDLSVQNTTPGGVFPTTSDITGVKTSIVLNHDKEVCFSITDKELMEVQDGVLPMAMQKAVKALAKAVNKSIFDASYKKTYQVIGTAGTTPFASDLSILKSANTLLTIAEADDDERRLVADPYAYNNAAQLSALTDASASASAEAIREGMVTRAVGFDWYEDAAIPLHILGAATGTAIAVDNVAGYAIGTTQIHIDGLTAAPKGGDLFTFAGHSTVYTIVPTYDAMGDEVAIALTGADADVTISPPLAAAVADGEALTFTASHTANLIFHRDAIGFASRPRAQITSSPNLVTIPDPVSGLNFEMEIQRQNASDYFFMRAIWGVELIRPALAVRLLG